MLETLENAAWNRTTFWFGTPVFQSDRVFHVQNELLTQANSNGSNKVISHEYFFGAIHFDTFPPVQGTV